MTKPTPWTPERVETLSRMWENGRTTQEIADVLNTSSPAVQHRAKLLNLGLHPITRVWGTGRRSVGRDLRGGIASAAKFREEDEGRVIRLPKLAFLEKRLSWEPAK